MNEPVSPPAPTGRGSRPCPCSAICSILGSCSSRRLARRMEATIRRITVTSACLNLYMLCFMSPTMQTVGSHGPRGRGVSSVPSILCPQSRAKSRACSGFVSWYSSMMKAPYLARICCKSAYLLRRSFCFSSSPCIKCNALRMCSSVQASSPKSSNA